MTKRELLDRIVARLESELAALTRAALATHAEATDEENKAEDKYDTRGLEASYLAHGQSKAADEVAQALAQFQALVPRDFSRNAADRARRARDLENTSAAIASACSAPAPKSRATTACPCS